MKKVLEYLNSDNLPAIILDNAYDSIICYLPILDVEEIIDFKLIYMNNSALSIFPGKKEDHYGKSFLSLFPYSKKNRLFEEMKKTFQSGKSSEHIYYFETLDKKLWSQNFLVKYEEALIVYFRDITEKKNLELEIERRNSELQMLMQEIHHRVKNNLQIISSLLNLQKEAIKDPHFVEALEVCSQRIQTIAIIHHRLYEEKNFSLVNLRKFIVEIVSSLLHLYSELKDIEIKYDMDQIDVEVDNVIKIGLIINELLTNTFKFAFNENKKGEVLIEIKKKKNSFDLKFSDNGKGLPEDFNIHNTESVGMVIIKAFTEQMGGTIEIISPPGTTFLITLPIHLNK